MKKVLYMYSCSILYPHINFEVGKFYTITDTEYCEVTKYIQHFGMASL